METSRSLQFIMDIRNRFLLSIKLMIRNKMTLIVLILAMFSTFFLLLILNKGAKNSSSFPVGIINLDKNKENYNNDTKLSEELLHDLTKVEALSLKKSSFDDLYDQLMDGKIFCIFVINEGYESNIRKGNFKNLITVYQGTESKISGLLKDIVAGEMMFRICLAKGIKLYEGLSVEEAVKFSIEDYESYAKELENSNQFDFKFDTQFVNVIEDNNAIKGLNNQLIYRQLIGAIFAILLSFVILFGATYLPLEQMQGLGIRRKLGGMNPYAALIGNLCSFGVLVFILCLMFSILLSYYVGSIRILAPIMGITYCYTLIIGILFILIGNITKHIVPFQFIGALSIILLGIGGMFSMIDGLTMSSMHFVHYLPNSWYIKQVTEIIMQGYPL